MSARGVLTGVMVVVVLAAAIGATTVVVMRTLRADAVERRAGVTGPDVPLAAEAAVFARAPGSVALDPLARRPAHPRTLATFRELRAYPGAPPRIPHGLTDEEYRMTRCRTCHEQGSYAQRFGAYAPVTPHPELADCLQCHLPDAAVVGLPLPDGRPDALCRQCHAPGASRAALPPIDWPDAWALPRTAASHPAPPPIPHDSHMREQCLACHEGPAAVAEIRTTHGERTDCRTCHVSGVADDPPGAAR